MSMLLIEAIRAIVPDADYSVSRDPGESDATALQKLQWNDARARPTDEAILAEVDRLRGQARTHEVDAERDRRIAAFISAVTEREHSVAEAKEAVADGAREASRLLNIKVRKPAGQWKSEHEARAQQLEEFDLAVEAIKEAARAIRADIEAGTYEGDIADDPRWP